MRIQWPVLILLTVALTACKTLPDPAPVAPEPAPQPSAPTAPPPSAPPAPAPVATVLAATQYEAGKQQRLATLARSQPEAIAADQAGYYLDVQQARLQEKLAGRLGLSREGERFVLRLPSQLGFATGSAQLRDEARSALSALAEVLREFRPTLISIFGHTDDTGPAELNQRLSEQRAQAVAKFLSDTGVARERLLVVGYGASQPVADNATPEGRDQNRRVELLLEPVVRR